MKSYVYGLGRLILVYGVIALCLAGQAGAVTITLEASQDNTLYDNSEGALSNGAGNHFFAGRNGASGGQITMRGLVMFDVASRIPPGAIINSVALGLNVSTPMLQTGMVTLHPVLAPWGEGLSDAAMGEAGGAPSATGDATWIHTHFDTIRWGTPGGDFIPAPSASFTVAANGPQVIESTPELVADVQSWLDDPGSNNGWLLRRSDEAMLGIRFDSRTHSMEARRPLLTIDFSLPPLLISPQSGIFALTQVSDIVVFVNLPDGITLDSATVLLDGADATADFGACLLAVAGTVAEGGQTFRCPSRSAEDIGVGSHIFEVILRLSDESSIQQAVNWTIVETTEP